MLHICTFERNKKERKKETENGGKENYTITNSVLLIHTFCRTMESEEFRCIYIHLLSACSENN
uniref:Uncharacterized protein n=1 Tax=Arundo donax TaxID=35708 RepID=A0A0A9GVZ2_ARUDO